MDFNAIDPYDMSVKLRLSKDLGNAKLPRTPYNVESAIASLISEVNGLNGHESLGRVLTGLLREYRPGYVFDEQAFINSGVEMLLNNFGKQYALGPDKMDGQVRDTDDRAAMILSELADIFEESWGAKLREFIADNVPAPKS